VRPPRSPNRGFRDKEPPHPSWWGA
jgi:hypothetical protein